MKGCYNCIHMCVCKYFKAGDHFPFVDDAAIKPYLEKIIEASATACRHYKREEET